MSIDMTTAPGTAADTDGGEAKEAKQPKISTFVVFAQSAETGDDGEHSYYVNIGEYKVKGNGGQREARKQALEDPKNVDLKNEVIAGEEVILFCVPKSSFKPHPVKLDEPRQPRIRF